MRRILLSICVLLAASSAHATSVTGSDWIVHYSLPDQVLSEAPGEYDIRDAFLARINALQSGQSAVLATYTFSAFSTAGKIVSAISNALDRGASVKFIADYTIVASTDYNGASLSTLAARSVNPLVLVQATSASGIMHDKLGLFDYGPTNRWLFIASWNFTSGASYQQWNIAIETKNAALFSAYTNEMRELLSGRFHYDPSKSHAHDGSRFRLTESWGDCWVRFAPYPDSSIGGTNAQTDITNLIAGAESEIVFGINLLTRPLIASSLVAAADRGVIIHGVIPKSDQFVTDSVYPFLTNAANYATTNVVNFVTPFSKADGSALDAGESDLVHEKWMVIDPWGEHPVLIHGSANWTDTALASENGNDENVLFLRHRDLARIFYAQFKRMTGMWTTNRDDAWCELGRTGSTWSVDAWMTGTNTFQLQQSDSVLSGWTNCTPVRTGYVGRVSFPTNGGISARFYRIVRP